jgi:anaerobic ribonucleoside-triphosphate reductase activating protein
MTPAEAVDELLSENVTGLTFSGGEPMEQAQGLAEVVRLARQKQDLDIICFTGYSYERLRSNPPNPSVTSLLDQIDVLIDGPYIAALNDSKGLRGSSNQRIIYLTSRLKNHDLESQVRRVEVRIEHDAISMIGIPNPPLLLTLDEVARVHNKRGNA